MSTWAAILLASGLTVFNLLCAALTLVQLPGMWLMLLAGVLVKWLVDPSMFTWTTLAVSAGITIASEIVELAAGAVGAKSQGASRRAVWGALVGGVIGAIGATFLIPIPLVGTLIGAAIGSGVGAAVMELSTPGRTGRQAMRVATGAAAGRLVASVLKLGFALANAFLWSIAAFVP